MRWGRTVALVGGVAALLLLAATFVCTPVDQPVGVSNGLEVPDVGDKRDYAAPDFRVPTFDHGRFHLASHKGTPVVLNFWESW